MTDKLSESLNTEASSIATPEKNGAEPTEKSSPAASDNTSHIVDTTEKWLGRSIIITGAPEPKG